MKHYLIRNAKGQYQRSYADVYSASLLMLGAAIMLLIQSPFWFVFPLESDDNPGRVLTLHDPSFALPVADAVKDTAPLTDADLAIKLEPSRDDYPDGAIKSPWDDNLYEDKDGNIVIKAGDGVIVINTRMGTVEQRGDMSTNEAALNLWKAIVTVFPDVKKNMEAKP